jgi:hypothetical protein
MRTDERRSSALWSLALFAVTAAGAAWPASAHADPTSIMVETDPSTFVLKGYAAHVRVALPDNHFAFGGGVYGLDFPSVVVDLNPDNRARGWNVRLQLGAAAFADYYFRPQPRGFFVGAQLAAQEYRYTNDLAPGQSATSVNLLAMPRVGYQWQPFDSAGFYVMPWLGLGVTAPIAGEHRIAQNNYSVFPLLPFAAVHVGWRF